MRPGRTVTWIRSPCLSSDRKVDATPRKFSFLPKRSLSMTDQVMEATVGSSRGLEEIENCLMRIGGSMERNTPRQSFDSG